MQLGSLSGGGVYRDSKYYSLALSNVLVAGNDAPVDADIPGDLKTQNSMVGVDPQFVRNPSAGPDAVWGTADDDYGDLRLRPGSLAIDAGSSSLAVDSNGLPLATDLDGAPRSVGLRVDIGAYEFQHVRGDADSDGDVDSEDFVVMKQSFLTPDPGWAGGDFNGDGGVDLDDFVLLKQNFTAGAVPAAGAPAVDVGNSIDLLAAAPSIELGSERLTRRRMRPRRDFNVVGVSAAGQSLGDLAATRAGLEAAWRHIGVH